MQYVVLAGIVVLLGILLVALLVWAMALSLLRPPRMTDARAWWMLRRLTPADLGLSWSQCDFGVRDERGGGTIRITGWWLPAIDPQSQSTVVLIHGYADAKVGAIAWAPLWLSLGYNVVAIDLRAHGESDGKHSTAGFFERDDLDAVINELRATRPDQTRSLVLFGVSLGAAVALATAARRDDLRALVLDCPFADYRTAARAHGRLMGYPLPVLHTLGVTLAEWISGARIDEVRPVDLIGKSRCPVLLITGDADPFVSQDSVASLERAVAARGDASQAWRAPDAGHVLCIVADYDAYRARIESFLSLIDLKSAADERG